MKLLDKKGFSIILVVIIIVIIAAVIWYFFFANKKPRIEIPKSLLIPRVDGNLKEYKNDKYGFKLNYPEDIFHTSELPQGISLVSPYSVTENPSGLPGKETTHTFSIDFELKNLTLLDAVKEETPYLFTEMFPSGNIDSFRVIKGLFSKFKIAGRDALSSTQGAEGINIQYVFAPKSENETLVIRFRYIGDFLKPKISEQKQKELFELVINTLQF